MDNLEFLIKLKADLTAGKITEEQFKKLRSAAEGAGAGMHKASGHAAGFGGELHKLGRIARVLHHQFPELANAMHVAMHPMVGLALAVSYAFIHIKESIAEYSKALDEVPAQSFKDAIEAQEKALFDADLAMGKYNRSIARVATEQLSYTEKADARIESIKAEAEAVEQLAEKQKALEIAYIHADKNRTPEEKAKAVGAVESRFAGESGKRKITAEGAVLNERTKETGFINQAISVLKADVERKGAAFSQASGNAAKITSTLATVRKGIDAGTEFGNKMDAQAHSILHPGASKVAASSFANAQDLFVKEKQLKMDAETAIKTKDRTEEELKEAQKKLDSATARLRELQLKVNPKEAETFDRTKRVTTEGTVLDQGKIGLETDQKVQEEKKKSLEKRVQERDDYLKGGFSPPTSMINKGNEATDLMEDMFGRMVSVLTDADQRLTALENRLV